MESALPLIRPFDERDTEVAVDFSLRAWAPVFASLELVLGSEIFRRLHPDWREDQSRAVTEICTEKKGRVWVAEVDGAAVGLVAVGVFDPRRSMGEISMLAVDSDYQGRGIGTALTEFALDRLERFSKQLSHRFTEPQISSVRSPRRMQKRSAFKGSVLLQIAVRDAGMKVAMVETGGDPGHAPARRTYEKAGCVNLPIARYFKNL